MDQTTPQNKGLEYHAVVRTEILPLLPASFSRVLDVGCGTGATGAWLKSKGAQHVSGIEIDSRCAAMAAKVLDRAECFDLTSGQALPYQGEKFDLILCLDVLEHLVDPWGAVKKISALLNPGGTLLVSVPNLRHYRTSLPLLFCGDFNYEESGTRDSTHLRFFTKKTAQSLVGANGLEILRVMHTGRPPFSATWIANILSLGLLREFFDFQYVIAARSAK